jgi:hypothetical protein
MKGACKDCGDVVPQEELDGGSGFCSGCIAEAKRCISEVPEAAGYDPVMIARIFARARADAEKS